MYDFIHTQNDVLREWYIAGADLVGNYQVPQLHPINTRLAFPALLVCLISRKSPNIVYGVNSILIVNPVKLIHPSVWM